MAFHEWLLPGISVLLLVVLVVLLVGLRRELRDLGEVDSDTLSAALSRTWREEGFDRALTDVERHAEQLETLHTDIAEMLRSPQARGEFGEVQLEAILSDHLPPEMYGLREQVVEGKTPDANIRTPEGRICIDSKFPLEQYVQAVQADEAATRDRHRRQFSSAVDRQLEKIATDYVRPEAGTTDFAVAFIPSEAVYYHLVTEEYDLLRSYTKRGVQVVSPLTFGGTLQLVKAGVQAKQLSEQAEAIRTRLQRLGTRFATLDDEWDVLRGHIQHAAKKADDVEGSYGALREEFERIERPVAAEVDDADR